MFLEEPIFNLMLYPLSGSMTEVSEVSITQITVKDDFEDFFDMLLIRICLTLTLLSEFFVSNVLAVLFVMFDKYGEDSMKRSLFNQIIAQVSYPIITSSLISTPCWILRLAFGPLTPLLAETTTVLGKNDFINQSKIVGSIQCLHSLKRKLDLYIKDQHILLNNLRTI